MKFKEYLEQWQEVELTEAEVTLSNGTKFMLYETPMGVLLVRSKDGICIKPCMTNSIELTTTSG